MAEEKFISKYTSTEIEAMLDKVKQDMQTIQYTQSEINTLLGKIQNGGGHTIIDGNDTQLNQETNLKFSKDFDVSDDSTNHNTEVEQHEISSSEWDEIMATVPSPGATVTPAEFTPVGTIISVMGTTAPQNYLACDGTVYNISQYQVLANYIKDQFGSYNKFGGDGTTTFAVPDLRGEFLRGTGTNSHANQGSGAAVGVHQDGTAHVNIYSDSGSSVVIADVSQSATNMDSSYDTISHKYAEGSKSQSPILKHFTSRPTNTSVLFCIATKNFYIDPTLDYSTDEKVVGTWIDNKPLYQKTVSFGALPNSIAKEINHNIANVDLIWVISAFAYSNDKSNIFTLPQTHTTNLGGNIAVQANRTTLQVVTGVDKSALTNCYITIQYTKTTD